MYLIPRSSDNSYLSKCHTCKFSSEFTEAMNSFRNAFNSSPSMKPLPATEWQHCAISSPVTVSLELSTKFCKCFHNIQRRTLLGPPPFGKCLLLKNRLPLDGLISKDPLSHNWDSTLFLLICWLLLFLIFRRKLWTFHEILLTALLVTPPSVS